ncbi:MAG TPA: diguanylate cyclase [Geobacteraceae bacterium]|nr:diguanylate cyclase [Geobacteraceae bacterium]
MKIKQVTRRLTLIQKLIASYAAIAFFSMAAILFSITGLFSLNKIAKDIARNDFTFIRSTNTLRDSINAQERYAAKYSILKSPEFTELFRRREAEFLSLFRQMNHAGSTDRLAQVSKSYNDFMNCSALIFQQQTTDLSPLKNSAEQVRNSLDKLYSDQQSQLYAKLEKANQKQNLTIQWSFIISSIGFILSLFVMVVFIYNTSSSMRKLKRATFRIAEGDFDFDPQIPTGDEFGDLARDFTRMAAKLKVLEQMCLDASPLTRLPGNIAIEKVLDRKLQEDEPFAVCYADLDNFKAYNDRYGYIKGSEVIKMTGEIIYDAVNCHSDESAFVGHVGGDDFVMVIPTKDVTAVCRAVIDDFTIQIRQHYNQQDQEKGAIEGLDRYGVRRIFPIMTISIAVLTCQKGEYDSAVKIAKAAVQIKEYVKETPGSNYLVNRRRNER